MNLARSSKPRYIVAQEENCVTITIESRKSVFRIVFFGACILCWFFAQAVLGIPLGYVALILWGLDKFTQPIQFFLIITFLFLFATQIFLYYYGFSAAYLLLRELTGKEIIEINRPKFIVTLQILDWMKPKIYGIEEIRNVRPLKKIGPLFLVPPWRRRFNETMAFDSDGKTFRFGVGLKPNEANEILSIIQKALA